MVAAAVGAPKTSSTNASLGVSSNNPVKSTRVNLGLADKVDSSNRAGKVDVKVEMDKPSDDVLTKDIQIVAGDTSGPSLRERLGKLDFFNSPVFVAASITALGGMAAGGFLGTIASGGIFSIPGMIGGFFAGAALGLFVGLVIHKLFRNDAEDLLAVPKADAKS